ncbi:MAG: hemerythrin domain-containing protein [Candidatus Pacearchaeota archaeon]
MKEIIKNNKKYCQPNFEHSDSCVSYLKNLDQNRKKIKNRLKPGHPIHTLMSEHEIILDFLEKLEKVNKKIQKMKSYKNHKTLGILEDVSKHLIEAEPHHEREEKVLFPEIEKRGVFGPTEVMRHEHEILRSAKKSLFDLTKNVEKLPFNKLKEKLAELVDLIVPILKDHISKEDNILYPISLEIIQKDEWNKLKEKCDKIGYCCFTPKEINEKLYVCQFCGLKYKEKVWAKKCEEWCKKHKSCNLEITKHAVQEVKK